MIVHRSYLCVIVPLIVTLFLLVTGCTHVLKVNDIPTLQAGSPLRSVGPKTFAFKEFKDIRRNVNDPALVAHHDMHTLVLDQPITTAVANQIRKELERNGHKFVNHSSDAKADFIVEGSVYDFTYRLHPGFFIKQTANAGVKIIISRIPSEKGVFMKSYEGNYNMDGGLDGWKISMNQALMAMLKEMSTDTELIEFINK